jgi:uncharacterized protein DUF4326
MSVDLFGNSTTEMKALSWKEPFGSLMLHGKIETRTWPTKYRGLVLMCASKIPYTQKQLTEITDYAILHHINWLINGSEYRSGIAFAVGTLVNCRPMRPIDQQQCFVKYRPGLWCHEYRDVRKIKPFDFKGAQKWKNVPQTIIDDVLTLGKRIQRKRIKGWRMPANTVYVGRPSKWGNPVALWGDSIMIDASYRRKILSPWVYYKKGNLFDVMALYHGILMNFPFENKDLKYWSDRFNLYDIDELRGKDLACWCPLDKACHADNLLGMMNHIKILERIKSY